MTTGQREDGTDVKPAEATAVTHAGDDEVLPFRTVRSGVEGRLVRLAGVAHEILGRHDYPDPVRRTLGEALALVAMLGAPLQDGGRLILEIRSSGPLRSLAVNFEQPGRLRGYAGFDRDAIQGLAAASVPLLGEGHLALTMEPGVGDSYQGVVAVDAGTGGVAEAACAYFAQSEGLPTFIRLAVARELAADAGPGKGSGAAAWRWRVGGFMIQHLGAKVGARQGTGSDADDEYVDDGADTAEEQWHRARILAETVEDHELIDPTVAPERLLYRLFHEEGVRVRPALPLTTYCRCSRDRISRLLNQFDAAELGGLKDEDGRIRVTCEFCGRSYDFEPGEPAAES